jgi:hypothetical protein
LWSLSHRRPDGDAEELFRLADEQLLEAKRRRGTGQPDRAGPRGRRAAPGQHTPARGIGAAAGSAAAQSTPQAPEVAVVAPEVAVVPPRSPGLEVFALGEAPLLDELLDQPLHRAPRWDDEIHEVHEVAIHNGSRRDRALRDTTVLDSAPTAGLPLYRALLRDPPRVDESEQGPAVPAPEAAPSRSRRRPKVIDLTREDDRRLRFD